MCTSLDCGRKPEHPDRTRVEHTNPTQKGHRTPLAVGQYSANHCATGPYICWCLLSCSDMPNINPMTHGHGSVQLWHSLWNGPLACNSTLPNGKTIRLGNSVSLHIAKCTCKVITWATNKYFYTFWCRTEVERRVVPICGPRVKPLEVNQVNRLHFFHVSCGCEAGRRKCRLHYPRCAACLNMIYQMVTDGTVWRPVETPSSRAEPKGASGNMSLVFVWEQCTWKQQYKFEPLTLSHISRSFTFKTRSDDMHGI